jgi:hypothetical protein
MNTETQRLNEAREQSIPWKQWGPYVSERQWGTVREDYSDSGNAWDYFSHDQARSRAYAWGEDGLAGISDDKQLLCFALALWNGQDAILKERIFGLTNSEGNHGEDAKEYYYYLDSTPTHSYMRYLYKYPQRAFPYDDLVQTNSRRSRAELEYELIDTGIFDDDRYFDVFVTYAKASPTDLMIEIEAANRGPEAATLHLAPTLWFRNTWSWVGSGQARPALRQAEDGDAPYITAEHPELGVYYLYLEEAAPLLFCENETNSERLFGTPNATPYVKDGINNYIVHGWQDAVNPAQTGSKAAAHIQLTVGAGDTGIVRLRLSNTPPAKRSSDRGKLFGKPFAEVMAARKSEADAFYAEVMPDGSDDDHCLVIRQALAGMLWSKQFYAYDVTRWLGGYGAHPSAGAATRSHNRNRQWFHLTNGDIISMPDKWEYPWYAAWDLAFHCIALNLVDPDFAKEQLKLMLSPNYLHPNGQIPAYEWNFSDVNPPVHAWAVLFMYNQERDRTGKGDIEFVKQCFTKLLMNFTWWVNRKDRTGSNVFEGGFLGLDNIGVFDRSASLPTGGYLEQADGTAWMAFYAQVMMRLAVELAPYDQSYEDMAIKFFEHFLWIVRAMDRVGEHQDELWDEKDGFFYDLLRFPDGRADRLEVRSLVGLLALCASAVVDQEDLAATPNFVARAQWLNDQRPDLTAMMPTLVTPGVEGRRLLAILDEDKLRRVLARMLDEQEFLSDYGIRSLSRFHREHPFVIEVGGQTYRVDYEPAESSTGLFGGNSNWRGPIWMPMNVLLVRGLVILHRYYGDGFTVECPTGSGRQMTLRQVAEEISRRLGRIFLRDAQGRRPVFGEAERFQSDPHWRDYLLFYEYFHGDNGAGIGASHQTGWTGLIARLMTLFPS